MASNSFTTGTEIATYACPPTALGAATPLLAGVDVKTIDPETGIPEFLLRIPRKAEAAAPDAPICQLASAGAEGDADVGRSTLEFIRITSRDPLTKTYGADPQSGQPAKVGEPNLCDGMVQRVQIDLRVPAQDFGRLLEGFGAYEALATGQLVDPRREVPLTTKSHLAASPDAIARTKGWAMYEASRPALLCFDHDAKDLPARLQDRIAASGGFESYMVALVPALADAAWVSRPSVSTGIRNRATDARTAGGGRHFYTFVRDGADVRECVKRLRDRMILEGHGYACVTKAGAILIRTPIDSSASGDPERLVFEGNAILTTPQLEHEPGARTAVIHEGGLLDTVSAVPALTDEERASLRAIEAKLRASVQDEAYAIRAQRGGGRISRASTRVAQGQGLTVDTYRIGTAANPIVLFGSHKILLDDGSIVTVMDILRDPAQFHEETCADPLEWDYGGGRNKAVIYTDSSWPIIFSHAHGGQTYELRLTQDEFLAILKAVEVAHAGA